MPALFRQLTLCGVGLIGGSLALIARKQGLVERIVGLGRTQRNLDVAMERGLIDFATRDPLEAAQGGDLVMLATPVMTFPETLAAMVPHLPAEAVVTDVGSVKSWVVRELEPLLGPQMAFVGVHPVAGKETTGAAAADETLYRDRRVIVTPSARSTPAAVEKVEALWRATGARLERMTPAAHDAILARASHLPQIVSSALAASLVDEMVAGKWAAGFGAGGLRDTTRIAASSSEMWRDICLTNRDAIAAALKLYAQVFAKFSDAVTDGDEQCLMQLFEQGRAMRERLK
ncbi:MAG TPA: prephenate dehydrogenase/arogenate dehydrogenase family protein [Candidatus Binataceae bacterium]|nr:prephenate dehydrogenase/arogenate dehydrogenase family protein [Candidatus Binataceae bacterium]